jgi:hypothetical protein
VVAFFASVIVLGLMLGIVVLVGVRRPVGKPMTWGEALLAGTFVFGLLLVAYGVVPDRWLRWADGPELGWRSDRIAFAISSKGIKFGSMAAKIGGRGKVQVTDQTLRDFIVSGIYVVMLGAQVALWSWWQKRGRPKPGAELEPVSAFGRPLVREA